MSVMDVTARIQQIQAQLAQLTPAGGTTGTAFADALDTSMETTLDPSGASVDVPAGGAATRGEQVVAEAKKYLGLPYVWGGTDPKKGLDCSGLVQLVYKNLGYDLPRVSNQQATVGTAVGSLAEARPGDLLAWDNSSRNRGVDHIAIYIGNGKMIEAPRTGLNVRIVDVPSTPDVIRREACARHRVVEIVLRREDQGRRVDLVERLGFECDGGFGPQTSRAPGKRQYRRGDPLQPVPLGAARCGEDRPGYAQEFRDACRCRARGKPETEIGRPIDQRQDEPVRPICRRPHDDVG